MFIVESQSDTHFENLTNLQYGWDFRVARLGQSQGPCRSVLYRTTNVGYNRFHYKVGFDQKLHSRPGMISFGLLDEDCPQSWTHHHPIPNNGIIVFPSDDDLAGCSPPGFRGSGIHFAKAYLAQLAEAVHQVPLHRLVPSPGIYTPAPEQLDTVRAELRKWGQMVTYGGSHRDSIVTRREESLALCLLEALKSAEYGRTDESDNSSGGLVARALEFIHSCELENLSATDLCLQAQCSQRNLEKQFFKRFGVTPKKYIKCLRLAKVREALRNFESKDYGSIIELAGIHGFWHMGQFAADYRRFYGELPSETIGRRRAAPPALSR